MERYCEVFAYFMEKSVCVSRKGPTATERTLRREADEGGVMSEGRGRRRGGERTERRRDWEADARTAMQHVSSLPLPHHSPSHSLPLCCSLTYSTFGPSHNLCPLLWPQRAARERRGALPLWVFLQPFFKSWDRKSLFHPRGFYLDLDYDWRALCALSLPSPAGIVCVHVLMWCLPLIVLSLAAGVDHHERGSPPARVWVSAPV